MRSVHCGIGTVRDEHPTVREVQPRKRFGSHQRGTQSGQIAFRHLGEALVKHVARQKIQHRVAQKLQALVVDQVFVVVLVHIRTVRHRLGEQIAISKVIADDVFEVVEVFQAA